VKKFFIGFERLTKTKIPDKLRAGCLHGKPYHAILNQLAI
jgi:hypothetical protein